MPGFKSVAVCRGVRVGSFMRGYRRLGFPTAGVSPGFLDVSSSDCRSVKVVQGFRVWV